MKRKRTDYFKLKVEGASNYFSAIIVIFTLMALCIFCMEAYQEVSTTLSIQTCMRKYLYYMESTGCLTSSRKVLLEQELLELGMADISFQGTDFEPVGYNQLASLVICGKVPVNSIIGFRGDGFLRGEKMEYRKFSKKITAKY